MGIEIERKFLVSQDQWREGATGSFYCQGYLVHDPQVTLRVRVVGDRGLLTIKGKVENLSRPVFEYEIPLSDAREMLQLWCGDQLIEKNRYRIPVGDLVWEVDEFLGVNQGLVLAEVELTSPDQSISLPEWIGPEVSGDIRYYNSYLVKHPYRTWQNS
ncbi:MAG: CYTH domain-containing protein [Cyanobacteria bacterium P01_F01_bin.42]